MAVVETKGQPKEEYCEYVVGPLFVRLGMVFEAGKAPTNAQGMERHPASAGRENKWRKFYFPKKGTNILEEGVSYEILASMKGAHHGELVLALRGNPNEESKKIVFGRMGENAPFGFDEGASFLTLWVMPKEGRGFNTLYIRYKAEGGDRYSALMIEWSGDNIVMNLDAVDIAEVPPHLLGDCESK